MASVDTDLPLRILHLEDSLADHSLTSATLRRNGVVCTLHRVETLDEFSAAIKAQVFDVILADYQLAGFTAVDAWNAIAGHGVIPPFVLLSGAIGEAAAVDAIRLGMADYVLKDQISRLPHVIARACDVHRARSEHAQAARELAASQQRLALLTEHLQDSIEKERAAIAREIHDDIGSALTAIRLDLAWIERHAQQQALLDHAQAASQMVQHALGASQRILQNLQPPALEQGLVAALEWLSRDFEQRTGVAVRQHIRIAEPNLPEQLRLVVYRTAQEGLTNIAKHAGANAVLIELSDAEGVLTLEVTDNGQGIGSGAPAKPQSFGLAGLTERAKTVGGWLDVSSQPGRGTSLILSVPLQTLRNTEDLAS